jgi:hypothetical protein
MMPTTARLSQRPSQIQPSPQELVFERFIPIFLITDLLLLMYWSVAGLDALGLVAVPADYLYSDYHQPLIVLWNWSFFPMDLLLSLSGLLAVILFKRRHGAWYEASIASVTLTFAAGFMAISYWSLAQDFSWSWWIPNLGMVLWPLAYLVTLTRRKHGRGTSPSRDLPAPARAST